LIARVSLVAVLLGFGFGAVAGEPGADDWFREGVASLRADDFAKAVDRFERSIAIAPRAATYCNLALSYDRWPTHERQAIDAYLACAQHDTSGRFRAHALDRARDLERRASSAPSPIVSPASAPPPQVAPTHAEPVVVALPAVVDAAAPVKPVRARRELAIAGGVVGSVALVCLGTAIGLEVKAGHTLSKLQAQYGTDLVAGSPPASRYDDARTQVHVGIGLYATTGVLGATALVVADLVRARRHAR
jgi:hypothetical protein